MCISRDVDQLASAEPRHQFILETTSALRAVSRSHTNALRFSNAASARNKRWERITAHHGKMAQMILISAEVAGVDVEGDDGFCSALMMCAGVAGDFASVKAIVLGREVRRLSGEGMGEIGGGLDDGDRFLGDGGGMKEMAGDGSGIATLDSNLTTTTGSNSSNKSLSMPSWQEKQYGKDTRILSAILYSNARAMKKNGLGNMLTSSPSNPSTTNHGYLDINSLHLLLARQKPIYKNKNIPGMTGTEIGLSTMTFDDEDIGDVTLLSKRERRKKFRFEQAEEGNTVDDLDPEFARSIGVDGEDFYDDEGNLMEEGVLTTGYAQFLVCWT